MVSIKQQLAKIVGPSFFCDEPAVLDSYAKDQSFVRASRPDGIVRPRSPAALPKQKKGKGWRDAALVVSGPIPISHDSNCHGDVSVKLASLRSPVVVPISLTCT
jgi:hypothetical protein